MKMMNGCTGVATGGRGGRTPPHENSSTPHSPPHLGFRVYFFSLALIKALVNVLVNFVRNTIESDIQNKAKFSAHSQLEHSAP